MTHPLGKRVEVAQAALHRFKGEGLVWGRRDCGQMAAFVLKRLGAAPRISRFGRYTTARTALRAVKAQGFADLAGWMDDIGLQRIAPASAWPGDIIGAPGPGLWPVSLTVALGNGRILAFHPASGLCEVVAPNWTDPQVASALIAWRSC